MEQLSRKWPSSRPTSSLGVPSPWNIIRSEGSESNSCLSNIHLWHHREKMDRRDIMKEELVWRNSLQFFLTARIGEPWKRFKVLLKSEVSSWVIKRIMIPPTEIERRTDFESKLMCFKRYKILKLITGWDAQIEMSNRQPQIQHYS